MRDLINFYLTELIKLRRTFAFWLTVIGAAIIPLMLIITYIYNWQMFVPATGVNPWSELFARAFNGIILFMPLYIILLIGLIFNIEYKANAWKHLLVLPLSRETMFAGKYLVVFTMVFAFMALFILFTLVAGEILGSFKAELKFGIHRPEFFTVLDFSIKVKTAVLAIISIHFWLGLKVRNLISALGIGLAGIALAVLMNGKGGYADFFPYAYSIMLLNHKLSTDHAKPERFLLVSMAYFLVFSLLAYFQFRRSFKG